MLEDATNESFPPSRGKVRMGVESLNYCIAYLDRTPPSLTLPLHGGGNEYRAIFNASA